MAKTNMGMPAELPDGAEALLQQFNYGWDNLAYAFRKRREIGKETTDHYLANPKLISFEELSDHGLFDPHATTAERAASLKWLEDRLKSN